MKKSRYKVCLLDDDADDLELLTGAFESLDCSSINCFKEVAALLNHLYATSPVDLPDLIVLDYYMPLMDGKDVIATIRGSDKFIKVTIIIYTSILPEVAMRELLTKGLDYFMTKANSFEAMKNHAKLFCDVVLKKQLSLSQ